MDIVQRLDALKSKGAIGGYERPHQNNGLSGGLTPWVIMPATEGPASVYTSEVHLDADLKVLEAFGPTQFFPGRRNVPKSLA